MNQLRSCKCHNCELPKQGDWKVRMEPEFALKIMYKFNLTGKPIRTFIAANHIFIQYKDVLDTYHIIIICQVEFTLIAVTINNVIHVKDCRLIKYIESVWNHNIVKKKLLDLL